MSFHCFCWSILCDIDTKTSCSFSLFKNWDCQLWGSGGYSYDAVCSCWVGEAEDAVLIWLPVVKGTATFFGIKSASWGLHKSVPLIDNCLEVVQKAELIGMLIEVVVVVFHIYRMNVHMILVSWVITCSPSVPVLGGGHLKTPLFIVLSLRATVVIWKTHTVLGGGHW